MSYNLNKILAEICHGINTQIERLVAEERGVCTTGVQNMFYIDGVLVSTSEYFRHTLKPLFGNWTEDIIECFLVITEHKLQVREDPEKYLERLPLELSWTDGNDSIDDFAKYLQSTERPKHLSADLAMIRYMIGC